MTAIPFRQVEMVVAELLRAAGLEPDRAARSARAIVLADAWETPSHGLLRLPWYLLRLDAGGIDPTAELRQIHASQTVVAYDGGAGLGHWQVWHAAEEAIQISASNGVGVVAVGNSSHCGALGVYAAIIRDAGHAGFVVSNGPAAMPAWGGSRAVVSTSPIAGAIASTGGGAIVDLATSAVTRGQIAQYARTGRSLEPNWAFDRQGHPTTNATDALAGMVAPLGGPKGFALAYLVEGLTGGLVGPALSVDVIDPFDRAHAGDPQRVAHLVVVLDPTAIDIDGRHDDRLRRLEAEVKSTGGRVPGASRRVEAVGAIQIDSSLRTELLEWSRRLGADGAEGVLAGE